MDPARDTKLLAAPQLSAATVEHVPSESSTSDAPRVLGKFELLQRVGAGGFGEVWKANDTELDRIVAIKLLHSGRIADASVRERFFREARAAGQLRHPGIAAVYEVTELEGGPAIVSAFIEGVTLRDLEKSRPIDFREAAALTAQVAEALDYAHAMKMVHRDVKPANIIIELAPGQDPNMLSDLTGGTSAISTIAGQATCTTPATSSTSTAGSRALLLDFGLALRDDVESTLTVDGQLLGTPAYMSPEQAAGKGHHVDRRSDVYSLGVVLYELLTGKLPFTGPRVALVNQVLHDEPRSPRAINPQTPRDLETICLKAMAKAPSSRYPTARAFAEDLQRWLAGMPILARHVGPFERAWRWCRRNKLAASLMAATGIALLAGTAVSTTMALIANRRADRIESINKDLDKANKRAVEQAGIAEEQGQLAYQTLQTVVFDIQSKLASVPNAQHVRGDLLKTALAGLDKLSAKLRADKRVDRSTAVATLNLAEVFRQISNDVGLKTRVSANELYDRAVTIFEQLLAAAPDDATAQSDLAEACVLFALNLSRTDDLGFNVTFDMVAAQKERPLLARARALGKRAIELRRCLLAATPHDCDAKYQLARALTEWTYQEMRSGDAETSRVVLTQSHGLLKALVAAPNPEVSHRYLFGRTASLLGDYYFDLVEGGHEQAAPFYLESLEVLRHLAAERPKDHEVQMEYANSWSRMADIHAARGDELERLDDPFGAIELHEQSLAAFQQELAVTQALESLAPNNVQLMADCSISYDHVSRELLHLKRYKEALPILLRVLEIRLGLIAADPENRRHHAQMYRPVTRLGTVYENLEQPLKALETYEMGVRVVTAYRTRTGDRSLDDKIDLVQAKLTKGRDKKP